MDDLQDDDETKSGSRQNAEDRRRIREARQHARAIDEITRELEPTDDDTERMTLEEMVLASANGKGMRFKIRRPAVKTADPDRPALLVKFMRPVEELTDPGYEVLGVPFGGPLMGRDADGQCFHPLTKIWLSPGDMVNLTYIHGYGPDDPTSWQQDPVMIGRAMYTRADERGHWFEPVLDMDEPLAARLLNPDTVRASSGAVGHLVRVGSAGMIDVWPVGELALFDTNDWRQPANDLAVCERKSALVETPEDAADRPAPVDDPAPLETNFVKSAIGVIEMDENETVETQAQGFDYAAMAAALAPSIQAAVKAEIDKVVNSAPVNAAEPATAAKRVNVNTQFGYGDPDPVEDFHHWIFSGESKIKAHEAQVVMKARSGEVLYKGALQEGTTTEGQYLVPAGVLERIIEKRMEQSIVDRLGVTAFTTDSYVFNIPTEGTAMTRFTIVAEEGDISAAENEPTFGQEPVTLYNFKKLIKISEELQEDRNSGLDDYLARGIGSAVAATDNYYVQIGAGTTEPEGVFVGGTAGLTLDAAAAIGAAEVPELLGKLKIPYRQGAVLLMNRTTGAYLAGLTGSAFVFRTPPTSFLAVGGEDLGIGYPIILTEDCAAITAGYKSMLFGNFSFYGWVRNRSLRVRRLVELYAGTGQIGLLANFRAGGAVLQAEAFQYSTHPTA